MILSVDDNDFESEVDYALWICGKERGLRFVGSPAQWTKAISWSVDNKGRKDSSRRNLM